MRNYVHQLRELVERHDRALARVDDLEPRVEKLHEVAQRDQAMFDALGQRLTIIEAEIDRFARGTLRDALEKLSQDIGGLVAALAKRTDRIEQRLGKLNELGATFVAVEMSLDALGKQVNDIDGRLEVVERKLNQ